MVDPRDTKPPSSDDPKGSLTGDLASRIARARSSSPAQAGTNQARAGEMTGIGRGFRLASEFVAAVVVGGAIGFAVDYFLPTRPWGMIILLLLGFAAGVLNVIRATAEMNAATAVPPDTKAVPDDEDE